MPLFESINTHLGIFVLDFTFSKCLPLLVVEFRWPWFRDDTGSLIHPVGFVERSIGDVGVEVLVTPRRVWVVS